ncbi:MAG TPA: hypothetical protein VFA43_19590 [Gemmatimonadaceae bacterium]|nr:hypothetical protein [Gemmatimonadaceae bacterium]
MTFTRSSFLANVQRGIRMGFNVGLGFSVIALVLYLASRENPFEAIHTSFWGGIAMYFVAGVCVGAIGGAMTPLMVSNIGLSLVGMILGWLADAALQITTHGINVWPHYDWIEAVIFSVLGIPTAFYTRSRVRAGARARARKLDRPS